jgi:hypothetical protein
VRGVLANRRRTADTPNLAAQGQSVSRKTVAEVPLTGLYFVPDSPLADVAEEVLPSRYTELRVTIVPGDNAVDFPLTHARE